MKIHLKNKKRFLTMLSIVIVIAVFAIWGITAITAAFLDNDSEKIASTGLSSAAVSAPSVSAEALPQASSSAAVAEQTQPVPAAVSPEIEAIRQKMINNDTEGLKVVYLTFDDGPSQYTREMLDLLAKYNVKATFFVNGRDDAQSAEAYKSIVNEGHALGNHTWSHSYGLYNTPDAFYADVAKLSDYLQSVTGKRPVLFRFPGGSLNANQTVIDGIVSQGYNYVDWNVVSGDGTSSKLSPEEITANIVNGVHQHNVSTVLVHAEPPVKKSTRIGLDAALSQLTSEGYIFLPLEEDIEHQRQVEPTN